jgi:uncharacterized protein YhjY with autotransporter beta-barrel domain
LCKLLLLLCLGVLGLAPAAAYATNPANIVTACPATIEVAAGGVVSLDTVTGCPYGSGLGTNYPAFFPDPNTGPPDVINTAHGTATNYQDNDQYLVYQNNGDGATSDSYVWVDANNIQHPETIKILNISTTSLPNATTGTTYSQTISVAGGSGANSFASTSLPAGLTLNSSSGVLSGTPTTPGTYSFTVTVTDTSAPNSTSVSRTYTNFAVANASISLSPTTLPNATVGAVYSQAISASNGNAPYTFSISTGSLPAGLSLSSGGTISGTPTAGGSFSFTVKATDSSSVTGTQAYTLTVNAPTITLSPTTLPGATQNTAYSQTLTASGGTATYTYAVTAGSMPAGLTLSSGGVLSGTPTVYGNYNFTITATDSSTGTGPYSGSRAYALAVPASTPTITTASVANGTVGVSYSQTISASNGNAPYTFSISAGSLPTGLSLSSGGVISGTPTAGGSYTFTVKVTDAASSTATQTYTGVTFSAPTITLTPSTLPAATQNSAYSQSLTASDGTSPYTYAVTSGSLPSGLALNANTGALSGTPTVYGNYSFTVTATDSSTGTGPYTGSQAYTLAVTASPPTITTASVASGTVGVSYSQTISASNGNAPYTFSISAGSLPTGLSLSSGGVISGTPTAGGTYSFTVKVTDNAGSTATKSYTSVLISAPTITLSPSTLPGATQNSSYSQTISASGGTSAYTYAVTSGSLPAGLTLSSAGALSGTPTVYGNYSFTVTATDSSTGNGPYTGSQAYTLSITASTPTITTASVANGTVGVSYNQTISSSNGNAPYTYSISAGSLPTGLSLSSGGVISGTPTAGGSYTFTVKVTDAASSTATQTYTGVTFSAPTLTLTPAVLSAAVVGTSYSQSFIASAGTPPYTYAESGTLPAGISWNAGTATLSGTPTQAGSFPITIQVTDSSGGTGPYTHSFSYTLQSNAPTLSITPANNTSLNASYDTAYSQTFIGGGGGAPYSFRLSAGSLPAGLSLSSAGVLSGTPTQAGSFSFSVQMTDSSTGAGAPFTTTATYSLTVASPTIGLTPGALGGGAVAAAYSSTLTASGGIAPYSYSLTAGALPAGVTLSSSGSLSGTPTAAGTFSFTVTATDANSYIGSRAYTLTITAPTLSLSPPSPLPTATAESAYSQTFSTSGGTAPYQYAVASGSLPTGLSLNSAGALTGTPTVAGSFIFSVKSTDSSTGTGAPFSATRSYSLTVNAPTLTLSPATLPNPAQAVTYSQQLSAGGGAGGYTYVVSAGALPAGLTLSASGLLSGTPSVNGPFSFTVTAKDSNNFIATQAYSITVNAPPMPIAAAKSAATPYDTAVAIDLSGSINGLDITAVSIAAQPSHGTVTVSGETVTYTPAATYYGGTDSFTYTATNPGGTSSPATVTVTVAPPSIPTVVAKSATTPYNTAVGIDLSGAISGVDITAVTVASQPTHGTVSVSGKTVTYTPAATFYGGTDTFTYTASNPGGTSTPATVTVTVGLPGAPTVVAQSATTPYATAASIDLTGAISGVDITAVTVASQPTHGTVSVSGKTVTYTPAATFYGGTDSFTYTATNPGGTSSPATVTIAVDPLNVPVAGALSVATTAGTAVTIQAIGEASGPSPYTGVGVASQPVHGSASANGPQIVYTPAAGYTGTDAFTYTVANHFGNSLPATVTVTVTSAGSTTGLSKTVLTKPNAPVTVDLGQIAPGSYVRAIQLGQSPGSAGTVTISQPTQLTFTPSGSYTGLVQISAALESASGQSTMVQVLVLVSSQPDPSKNAQVLGVINAQSQAAQEFAQSELDNINQRLESLHDGTSELFSSHVALSLDGKSLQGGGSNVQGRQRWQDGNDPGDGSDMFGQGWGRPGIGAAGAIGYGPATEGVDAGKHADAPGPEHHGPVGLGVWINGRADFGSFRSYRQAAGFDSDNIAINMGADQRIGHDALMGMSFGYAHNNSRIDHDGTRSIAQGYSAALYGSYAPTAQTYLDAILGGGGLLFDSRRYDADSNTLLTGRRTGNQWFGSLTGGYEYRHGGVLLSPYGRYQWSRSQLNGYTENGVASAALAYGAETVRTSQLVLGLRASSQVKLESGGVLVPRARLELGHDFQGTSNTTLSYAFIPTGGTWMVLSNPYMANGTSVQFSLGTGLQLPRELTLGIDYGYLLQPRSHDQMFRMGLSKQF